MPICPACRGQKKIQGMGSMGEVDCKTCKGTGLEPVTVEIKPVEHCVEQKVSQSEITRDPTKTYAILEIKTKDISQGEALELSVETHEAALEKLCNSVEPLESKQETITEKLKRKYTKSIK